MPSPARKPLSSTALAALGAYSVDLFDGDSREPKTEFRIFPAGVVKSRKGDFLFDDQAAAALMAAYEQHGVDLTVDYDHHTLYTSQGVKAVSAGWFHLDVRNGELWAKDVNWNPPAVEHFANGEYRYFSPLFDYERGSGRITNLINNALTNTPAMDGIEALIAASATTGDSTMTDEEIKKLQAQVAALTAAGEAKDRQIKALEGQTVTVALATTVGLAATAPDAEVRTAVTSLAAYRKQTFEVLGVQDEAKALGALSALKQTANEAGELRTKMAEIETVALANDWKSYLDNLSTAGKDGKFLTPARRTVVEDLAIKTIGGGTLTPKGVEAGKVAALGMLEAKTGGTFTPTPGSPAISQLQADINARMGIDNAKFAAAQVAGGR